MVQVTARELGLLDPANRELYATNSQRYIGQIEAADREARELLSPLANRTFIVYHPAFGYFADDYNLTMVALEEEGKEADPRRMRESSIWLVKRELKLFFIRRILTVVNPELLRKNWAAGQRNYLRWQPIMLIISDGWQGLSLKD